MKKIELQNFIITNEMMAKWANHKNISLVCPLCTCREIELGDIILSPLVDNDGTIFNDGGRPMIQLHCRNCHYITLFMAKPILEFFQD